jgi:cell surface protein SprA
MELTRNIWRTFKNKIDSSGIYSPITTDVNFNVNGVNIEENDKRTPLPYRTPEGYPAATTAKQQWRGPAPERTKYVFAVLRHGQG